MSRERHEAWLQITAGTGPAECAWAVVEILERMRNEAAVAQVTTSIIELVPGPKEGAAYSVLVSLEAAAPLGEFIAEWSGTVQWIARSPFRPRHKRKNWFVGITGLFPAEELMFDPNKVRWETMRASGPGGQHVNRTESAVRVTHLPTGIQASACGERSQHRNRKLATARLAAKLAAEAEQRERQVRDRRWRAHHDLERGNPVRIFRGDAG